MAAADITQQLDAIQKQLDFITEELEIAKRRRTELDELKQDLTMVAKDAFGTAVEELEDVAPFVNTGDFLYLVKKILRNTNNITGVIEKLESTIDFLEDGKPIGKELFGDMLNLLDEMDRKGYFMFLKEASAIMDNIVSSFTIDDVKNLADNIVTILNTIKKMTQPEMIKVLDNAVDIYSNLDPSEIEEYSIWKAAREMNSPEMKRGLGFMITFLKNVAAPTK